ncbi:MAG: hypothetical protein ACE37K_15595 [Planctomycetota bacterium]
MFLLTKLVATSAQMIRVPRYRYRLLFITLRLVEISAVIIMIVA